MGMPISIHVRAADTDREDVAAAVRNAFAHLRQVDRVFSVWRADSDVLRLVHGELEPGEAHPWVAEIVETALLAEERTDGLFQAWRARPAGRTAFDPTGVVKGWAVAGAATYLDTLAQVSYSIGAGGDIVVGTGSGMTDAPPSWRIGIENPRDRTAVAEVVTLTSGAVATSGAAARGGHVVDPYSGAEIWRTGSATVVGPDLVWADIWATAAWVDPRYAGALLAERDPEYRLVLL